MFLIVCRARKVILFFSCACFILVYASMTCSKQLAKNWIPAAFQPKKSIPLLSKFPKQNAQCQKCLKFCIELDRCISTLIYIGRYDNVANVSYRQNSADIYRQYLLIKVLRCCSAWSVRKPKLLLRLWPCLINANALYCS